jgi:hypothetical protein
VDYRSWGDGEHWAPARPASDSPDRVPGSPPVNPPAGGRAARVPGQRSHGYDEELAHRYAEADPGWNGAPPPSGRHRRPDYTGETAPDPRSDVPGTWHAERRWRPTLDPTDWRYATDDVGYPYGPAGWEDDRSVSDRHREASEHVDRYDAHYAAGRDVPQSRPRYADDATEVFGAIRDQRAATGRGHIGPDGWAQSEEPAPWHRSSEPGRWRRAANEQRRRSTEREPWSPDVTGHWELPSDTGQWDHFADTGDWLAEQPTGAERGGPGRPPDLPHRQDAFWSGIRLAGDDPRWTGTPSSAPHSPAVSLPHEGAAPPFDEPSAAAPLPAGAAAERDHVDTGPRSMLAAMLFTVAWYVVPALVLLAWILTLDGSAPQDCAIDAAQRCVSARAQAAAAVIDAAPRAAVALGASVVIAVLLRWASGWRTASVGLAAAVIGGGMTTLLTSVISGQPLG